MQFVNYRQRNDEIGKLKTNSYEIFHHISRVRRIHKLLHEGYISLQRQQYNRR